MSFKKVANRLKKEGPTFSYGIKENPVIAELEKREEKEETLRKKNNPSTK